MEAAKIDKYLFTIEETASIQGITVGQVEIKIQEGKLKAVNFGTPDQPDLRIIANDFYQCCDDCSAILSDNQTTYQYHSQYESFEITLLRINLKSSGKNPGEYCIKNGLIGMGWGVESIAPIEDWETYKILAKEQSIKIDSVSLLQKIPVGSFVWTRQGYRTEARFFLGMITGEWEYLETSEAKEADVRNVRKCIRVKIGDSDTIIQEIKKSFTPTTFEYIRNKTAILYTKKLIADLINKGVFPNMIGLTKKNHL